MNFKELVHFHFRKWEQYSFKSNGWKVGHLFSFPFFKVQHPSIKDALILFDEINANLLIFFFFKLKKTQLEVADAQENLGLDSFG